MAKAFEMMLRWRPMPNATMAMIAATPITTPITVRLVRSFACRRFLIASAMMSLRFIV